MSGRKMFLKRFLPGMFALLTFFSLTGCSRVTDTSGLSGLWILNEADSGAVLIPDSLVESNMLRLRLDPGGGGEIVGASSEGRILWRYEEGIVHLRAGNTLLSGTIEGSELILQSGDETRLHFVREDRSRTSEEQEPRMEESFLGSWYGWWKIEDSQGKMPVTWYDCCAVFEGQEDGTIFMTLWDEDGSRAEPLSQVRFRSEKGALVSLSGYFAYMEIRGEEWHLTESEPAILIPDIQHDAEGETFRATVYLRRWGESWSSTLAEQRPFYYEDWYLPLLKKRAEMPDQIPWQRLEAKRERPDKIQNALSDRS